MQYSINQQQFEFGELHCSVLVPDYAALRDHYHITADNSPIPYWAKLWPSSIALCEFIAANKSVFKNKKVIELAAGLGLPSLLVASIAHSVICSDYMEEAVAIQKRSVALNGLPNIDCRCIDWHHYPDDIADDIVLLSDINYEPGQFDVLLQLIIRLINKGSSIILTTPQRIMAKPFIEKLLPYSNGSETISVNFQGELTEIFLLHLHKGKQAY